jgi:hypothetical protein
VPSDLTYLDVNDEPASFIVVPPIGPVETKPPDVIVAIDVPLT